MDWSPSSSFNSSDPEATVRSVRCARSAGSYPISSEERSSAWEVPANCTDLEEEAAVKLGSGTSGNGRTTLPTAPLSSKFCNGLHTLPHHSPERVDDHGPSCPHEDVISLSLSQVPHASTALPKQISVLADVREQDVVPTRSVCEKDVMATECFSSPAPGAGGISSATLQLLYDTQKLETHAQRLPSHPPARSQEQLLLHSPPATSVGTVHDSDSATAGELRCSSVVSSMSNRLLSCAPYRTPGRASVGTIAAYATAEEVGSEPPSEAPAPRLQLAAMTFTAVEANDQGGADTQQSYHLHKKRGMPVSVPQYTSCNTVSTTETLQADPNHVVTPTSVEPSRGAAGGQHVKQQHRGEVLASSNGAAEEKKVDVEGLPSFLTELTHAVRRFDGERNTYLHPSFLSSSSLSSSATREQGGSEPSLMPEEEPPSPTPSKPFGHPHCSPDICAGEGNAEFSEAVVKSPKASSDGPLPVLNQRDTYLLYDASAGPTLSRAVLQCGETTSPSHVDPSPVKLIPDEMGASSDARRDVQQKQKLQLSEKRLQRSVLQPRIHKGASLRTADVQRPAHVSRVGEPAPVPSLERKTIKQRSGAADVLLPGSSSPSSPKEDTQKWLLCSLASLKLMREEIVTFSQAALQSKSHPRCLEDSDAAARSLLEHKDRGPALTTPSLEVRLRSRDFAEDTLKLYASRFRNLAWRSAKPVRRRDTHSHAELQSHPVERHHSMLFTDAAGQASSLGETAGEGTAALPYRLPQRPCPHLPEVTLTDQGLSQLVGASSDVEVSQWSHRTTPLFPKHQIAAEPEGNLHLHLPDSLSRHMQTIPVDINSNVPKPLGSAKQSFLTFSSRSASSVLRSRRVPSNSVSLGDELLQFHFEGPKRRDPSRATVMSIATTPQQPTSPSCSQLNRPNTPKIRSWRKCLAGAEASISSDGAARHFSSASISPVSRVSQEERYWGTAFGFLPLADNEHDDQWLERREHKYNIPMFGDSFSQLSAVSGTVSLSTSKCSPHHAGAKLSIAPDCVSLPPTLSDPGITSAASVPSHSCCDMQSHCDFLSHKNTPFFRHTAVEMPEAHHRASCQTPLRLQASTALSHCQWLSRPTSADISTGSAVMPPALQQSSHYVNHGSAAPTGEGEEILHPKHYTATSDPLNPYLPYRRLEQREHLRRRELYLREQHQRTIILQDLHFCRSLASSIPVRHAEQHLPTKRMPP